MVTSRESDASKLQGSKRKTRGSLTRWAEAPCGRGGGWGGGAVLRHPAKSGSRSSDRSISWVSALPTMAPFPPLLSAPSLVVFSAYPITQPLFLSFPASFPSLFLSIPNCQNQLRSHHLWEHS